MKQRLATLALCLLTVTSLACGSIQATGEAIDETSLVTRVEARLAADPEVSAFDIGVSAENGIVTLTGKVDDREAAAEAVELAGDTAGARGVINRLDVPMPQDEMDAQITAQVEEALASLGGADIEVRTENSVVTLVGTVPSEDVRSEAMETARDVDGVTQVKNGLRVAG